MTPNPRPPLSVAASVRRTRTAAAAGSLALAAALVMSSTAGGLVQETEAQAVDSETVTVDGTIAWSGGGFARTASNSFTNHASYTPPGEAALAAPIDATAARNNFTSTADPAITGHVGTWGDDDLDGEPGDAIFEIGTPGDRPATAVNYCLQTALPGFAAERQEDCLPGGPEYTNEAQSRAKAWGRSGGTANPPAADGQPAVFLEAADIRTMVECSPTGQSWALVPTALDPAWGRGIGVTTRAGDTPGAGFTALEPEANSRVSAWIPAQHHTHGDAANKPADDEVTGAGLDDDARPASTTSSSDSAFFHVSLTSRAYAVEGYALSDLYATVDQYHHESKEHLGSFTMVFARSECGVKLGPIDHQPLAADFESPDAPAYPADPASEPVTVSAAAVPDENGIEAVRSSRVAHRPGLTGQSQDDVPPTTVASSIDPDAGPETTTLAVPSPDDNDDDNASTSESTEVGSTRRTTTAIFSKSATTTTTRSSALPTTALPTLSESTGAPTQVPAPTPSSGVPPTRTSTFTPVPAPTPTLTSVPSVTPTSATEVVIPDEPATISPRTETKKVGTAEVGEDKFAVIVEGDELPSDRRLGVRAFEDWLAGDGPGRNWDTFVSDDPDRDGWRWAIISQRTGSVFYIR